MSTKSGYFPLFWDISDKEILVIGAGRIAERRINTLSKFDTNITIIAPETTDLIKRLIKDEGLGYIKDYYSPRYLEGADIVLACTSDEVLNHQIAVEARKLNIWTNNCSRKEDCDFYFPAIAKNDKVTVAINAGGSDHKAVSEARKKIEEVL